MPEMAYHICAIFAILNCSGERCRLLDYFLGVMRARLRHAPDRLDEHSRARQCRAFDFYTSFRA